MSFRNGCWWMNEASQSHSASETVFHLFIYCFVKFSVVFSYLLFISSNGNVLMLSITTHTHQDPIRKVENKLFQIKNLHSRFSFPFKEIFFLFHLILDQVEDRAGEWKEIFLFFWVQEGLIRRKTRYLSI